MTEKKEIKVLLDSSAYALLDKRAKKVFLSVSELVSEILRRSVIATRRGISSSSRPSDDKFIDYFSRRK